MLIVFKDGRRSTEFLSCRRYGWRARAISEATLICSCACVLQSLKYVGRVGAVDLAAVLAVHFASLLPVDVMREELYPMKVLTDKLNYRVGKVRVLN